MNLFHKNLETVHRDLDGSKWPSSSFLGIRSVPYLSSWPQNQRMMMMVVVVIVIVVVVIVVVTVVVVIVVVIVAAAVVMGPIKNIVNLFIPFPQKCIHTHRSSAV